MYFPKLNFLIIFWWLSWMELGQAELEAITIPTKLPPLNNRLVLGAIYDGGSSIYLININAGTKVVQRDIFRFNVSDDTIELFAQNSDFGLATSVFMGEDGNFYYFHQKIHMTDPLKNSTQVVGEIPRKSFSNIMSGRYADRNKVYMFGDDASYNNEIKSFDMGSHNISIEGHFPVGPHPSSWAVSLGGTHVLMNLYLAHWTPSDLMIRLDLGNFVTEVVSPNIPRIFDPTPKMISNGRYSYFIVQTSSSTGYPSNGIVRVDPDNMKRNFLPVSNFPVSGSNYYRTAPTAVYVHKLHRVYYFGGQTNSILDDIFYINLPSSDAPMSTTTTEEPITTTTEEAITYGTTEEPTTATTEEAITATTEEPITETDATTEEPTTQADDHSTTEPPRSSTETTQETDPQWDTTETLVETSTVDVDLSTATSNFPNSTLNPTTTGIPQSSEFPSTSTSTPTPSNFSCINRPDGVYPHPTETNKFIICLNYNDTTYSCPIDFIFDPLFKECQKQDEDCRFTCDGKPDGSYPHPHDCSIYFICKDAVEETYTCPYPNLFDPNLLNCIPPEIAKCCRHF